MGSKIYTVLFLCTGNSARSILAECVLNRLGAGKFKGYSAGSMPRGQVNPDALALLQRMNFPAGALRSKSWVEFSGPEAVALDFVFTLCDSAADEACPVWPGRPVTAHWGLPDPAAVEGCEAVTQAAFSESYRLLSHRIGDFVNLPIRSLDKLSLQRRLEEIGRAATQTAEA